MVDTRYVAVTTRVQDGIEAAFDLGLSLAGMEDANVQMERERGILPEIDAMALYEPDGTIVASVGSRPMSGRAPAEWRRKGRWQTSGEDWRAVGTSLSSNVSDFVCGVAVVYSVAEQGKILANVARQLGFAAAAAALGSALFCLLGIAAWRRFMSRSVVSTRILVAYVLTVILVGQAALAAYSDETFSRALAPELHRNTEAVARSLAVVMANAVDRGIPFDAIEGTEAYFAKVREGTPSVGFIAMARPDGTIIHADGLAGSDVARLAEALGQGNEKKSILYDLPTPIGEVRSVLLLDIPGPHGSPGKLYLGITQKYLDKEFGEIRLDILVVFGVSLVIAAEVLRYAIAGYFSSGSPSPFRNPLALTHVRLLTFLFMFAEQLSRPFLPLFVRGLLNDAGNKGYGAEFWSGLPISAFMAAVGGAMMFAPLVERFGCRRTFLAGAFAATVGLAGSSFCVGIADFILWRVVTAIGYALMFMAGQQAVVDNTNAQDRAAGIGVFVSAIMVSELCAPGIGGILAERLGQRAVFTVGAIITAVAGILAVRAVRDNPSQRPPVATSMPWSSLRNPRFVLLLLTAAVPAKVALTSLMFFAVPVALTAQASNQAEIGRIAMLYAAPSILTARLFARMADRLRWGGLLVGLGGMIAGAGFVPVLFWNDTLPVMIGVFCLGVGQAMSIAPQLVLATDICRDTIARNGSGSVLGPYRLVERIGSALGPLAAGALSVWLGPIETLGVLGAATFGFAVLFSVVFLVLGVRSEAPAADGLASAGGVS